MSSEPTNAPYDIVVIGGGVNGTGIARDAAGRGYSVLLAEMHDLASGTSSAATKLVHGGLRYLEHYEFRLVHESLAEREVLWASAPHLIKPLRFVLPHEKGQRPAWLLRLGLLVYDNLGGRKLLPGTRTLDLTTDPAGVPLKPGHRIGFEYSDCWVDDARLVALNARDAANRGAEIRVGNRVASARRADGLWQVTLEGNGAVETVRARLLVNAAGPWVDRVIHDALGWTDKRHVRLVKGSHIVTHRLFDHDRCYFFQNPDGRIFFAIPYEDDFTLIGTTDVDYKSGDPGDVRISDEEIDYLLAGINRYFSRAVTRAEIAWSYSGVRPLFDDAASAAQEATRDYVIRADTDGGTQPPVLNVFGGKLTTYRRLSEEVVDEIGSLIGGRGARWTRDAKLPGGDFPTTGLAELAGRLVASYPWLDPAICRRLARSYGTRTAAVLGEACGIADLGEDFGHGLHAREVDYLMAEEWARTADDVLWRRSKLGLRLDAAQRDRLAAYMARRL